jgi:hypothetical protein
MNSLFFLGLYLRPEFVPNKLSLFRGIAIRLAENILVTKDGPINLSENVSPRDKATLASDTESCWYGEEIQNFMGSLLKRMV